MTPEPHESEVRPIFRPGGERATALGARLGEQLSAEVDLSTDAIVYEAVFRVFRNAFVDHTRTCLQLQFQGMAVEKLRHCISLDEWSAMEKSIEDVNARGQVQRTHEDVFDYIGINHFYGVMEVFFAELLEDGSKTSAKVTKISVLRWLKEIKDVRDPTAHPSTQEISVEDAFRTIDNCRKVCRKLGLQDADALLQVLERRVLSRLTEMALTSEPGFDDTLPPSESIVADFIGREEELAQLRAWLRHDRKPRWLLVGEGGKGKTAIAYQFATEANELARGKLCGVFWLSAKRRRYDAREGTIKATAGIDFDDLESSVDCILSDYGFSDELDKSLDDKRDLVIELLNELPVLLIVDDLDSVQPEDEDAVEFLTIDVGQTKTKVLFTSRRQFAGLGNTQTVVTGLDLTESLLFIETKGMALGLSSTALTSQAMMEVFELCEGSPLYMEDLLRLAVAVGVAQAIQSWRNSGGDTVRRYALEREREMLTPLAREILDICALADRPLSLLSLAAVANRAEGSVAGAVDELRRLHLVPAADGSSGTPSFQVNMNLGLLVRATPAFPDRWQRYANALTAVSGQAFTRTHQTIVRDSVRLARLQLSGGSPIEAERTLQGALAICPDDPYLFGLLGVVYAKFKPQRAVDAREQWERAHALGSSDRRVYVSWANMELAAEKFDSALDAAMRGLERVKNDADLLQLAGYASSRMAQRHAASLNETKATREFRRSDNLISKALELKNVAGTNARSISRAYMTYLMNAEVRQFQETACRRLGQWLAWAPDDPYAKHEALKRLGKCPGLLDVIDPGLREKPL